MTCGLRKRSTKIVSNNDDNNNNLPRSRLKRHKQTPVRRSMWASFLLGIIYFELDSDDEETLSLPSSAVASTVVTRWNGQQPPHLHFLKSSRHSSITPGVRRKIARFREPWIVCNFFVLGVGCKRVWVGEQGICGVQGI